VGRARDPACVGCHVTGFLQPGGWTLPTGDHHDPPHPALADVGCEACHGPGQAHAVAARSKPKIGAGTGTETASAPIAAASVSTATCLGCHTPDVTNGDFDERAFRAAIVGPGHGRPAGALAPGPRPPL
jgi:hypothetical protein